MHNPLLIKNFTAGGNIAANRFVKLSADGTVVTAAADTDAIIGVNDGLAADSGARADVILAGIATVAAGGNITRGALVTSDATGQAVTSTENNRNAGIALVSAVQNDLIPVLVAPSGRFSEALEFMAEVTVATGAVKTLNGSPVELVATPGLGKAIAMIDATLFLDYATTAYDGIAAGEDLEIRYTNGSGALVATIETTGFLDASADAVRYVLPASAAAVTPVANAALVLDMAAGNIATGDSPLKVRVRYRIIDTAW